MTVSAHIYTDDHARSVTFDAQPYLHEATPDALLALAVCGWGGDDAADEVAYFLEDRDPLVAHVLDGVHEDNGFEVHVDEGQALAWIKDNRADVYAQVMTLKGAEHGDK